MKLPFLVKANAGSDYSGRSRDRERQTARDGKRCTWYPRMDAYRGHLVTVERDPDGDFRTEDTPDGSDLGPKGYTAFRAEYGILCPSEDQIRTESRVIRHSAIPGAVLSAVESSRLPCKEDVLDILQAHYENA